MPQREVFLNVQVLESDTWLSIDKKIEVVEKLESWFRDAVHGSHVLMLSRIKKGWEWNPDEAPDANEHALHHLNALDTEADREVIRFIYLCMAGKKAALLHLRDNPSMYQL